MAVGPKKLKGLQTKKGNAKKPKLVPQEARAKKLKADHIRSVRSVFRNVGFERVPEIAEKDVEFLSQKGEFDDCFIYENLIVLIEYTASASNKIGDHLKHKKILFDKVIYNRKDFIAYLISTFPIFATRLSGGYHRDRYKLKIAYCARFDFDAGIKAVVDSPAYLDYPVLKYFEKMASAVKLSIRPEFLGRVDGIDKVLR